MFHLGVTRALFCLLQIQYADNLILIYCQFFHLLITLTHLHSSPLIQLLDFPLFAHRHLPPITPPSLTTLCSLITPFSRFYLCSPSLATNHHSESFHSLFTYYPIQSFLSLFTVTFHQSSFQVFPLFVHLSAHPIVFIFVHRHLPPIIIPSLSNVCSLITPSSRFYLCAPSLATNHSESFHSLFTYHPIQSFLSLFTVTCYQSSFHVFPLLVHLSPHPIFLIFAHRHLTPIIIPSLSTLCSLITPIQSFLSLLTVTYHQSSFDSFQSLFTYHPIQSFLMFV